jgi:hypothetical protein
MRVAPLAGAPFREASIELIVLRKRRLPGVVRTFTEMLIEEISGPP